jgi:Uma2 family endonuclease
MTDLPLEQTIEQDVFETSIDLPPTDLSFYRFSVEQYHAMIEAGILTEDDHVELLEGWIVEKMTKKPTHPVSNELVADALRSLVPAGWFVRMQDPITTQDSEPEPDGAVVKGKVRDYITRHPLPSEVALVVEVADATVKQDRTVKQRIYARAGIPVYWIVNLENRKLEVYTQPGGSRSSARYVQRVELGEAASVEVVIAGAVIGTIPVSEILP